MTSDPALASAARKQLVFQYDHEGNRVAKIVSTWNGSAYANPQTTKFIYDGWRLIEELDGNNQPLRSYMWGTDLSGTVDGAAGIGGIELER